MEMRNVKYGVSPIAWSNDDLPSLGGDTPLEKCLADTRDAGFDGIELGGKFPREAGELRHILKEYDLQLVSGWFSGLLQWSGNVETEKERIKPHLELLNSMGCSVLVYADVSESIQGKRDVSVNRSPSISDDQWDSYGALMTELADYVVSEGLKFAYHHHMGTLVEDGNEVEQFITKTGDNVQLTFDTGHAAMAGIDPAKAVEKYFDRIAHFHCKDIRAEIVESVRQDDTSFLDGVLEGMFTVPGDGSLDFNPILTALFERGYEGWLIVEAEQDPAIANPKEYSEMGLKHLRGIVGAV